ncbi:DinB family protein [Paenibacillus lautus]|uniref:DinB family protein n=1 Tax=Paenibacillus lautus TaxID=1401 RepID=UPI001C10B4D6|nr:DinB family protein [Paenibacillus lautus]MBU5348081.1 DinB family protein [Paenibacillus lautus]
MSEFPIEAFVNTHDQLLAAVAGLSEDQLQWKQAPHIWSVQEVLSHLVDHSIVVSFRIRDILAGTTAQLPAFNQDAWVNGQYSNEGRAEDMLEAFRALLHYNSLLLRRLSGADTAKTGINVKGETVSVSDIVNGFTRHVQNHLGQIERIKLAAAPV